MSITESSLTQDESSDASGHTLLTAIVESPEEDPVTWLCYILLGSSGDICDEDVDAHVVDYTGPAAPRIEVGSLVPVSGEHDGTRGFDPASGCYVIAPDRHRVRLVIGEDEGLRYSPAFKIHGADNREAWVYVDHLIFDRVAYDAEGDLIFQLPGAVRKPTVIEVLFRQLDPQDGA
jgi:hypothetical protein